MDPFLKEPQVEEQNYFDYYEDENDRDAFEEYYDDLAFDIPLDYSYD